MLSRHIVLALTLILSGAAVAENKPSETGATIAPEIQQAIDKAVSSADKANTVGGEWRDTREFIEQAKEAATAGDTAKAMQLAQKAEQEGELGYQQALDQRQPRVDTMFR